MKVFVYLGLILLLFSCGEQQKVETKTVEKSEFNTAKKHTQATVVLKKFEKDVENWKEHETLNDFIQKFQSISPNNALSSSRELNTLVKSLNDSIKPVFLESPSFNARVNLLYNETLRLYDMSSISSIKAEEVNLQVSKMLHAYSSVNSRINTTILQRNLEEELENPKTLRKPSLELNPKEIDLSLEKEGFI